MLNNDVFEDAAALRLDLNLLENILWSRLEVSERLVAKSNSRDPDLLDQLRIESMYQFVEFFFLIRARRIDSSTSIEELADIHNSYIVSLTKDKEKMQRLGLRKERLLDAMFSGDTLPRLVQTWKDHPGLIDQSNLARFLVSVMSTETCRKLTVAAAQAGFLTRRKSPYGSMLVGSTGVMEQVFGSVIRDLRQRILQSHV